MIPMCLFAAMVLATLPEVTQLDWGPASLRELPAVAVLAEDTAADVRRLGITPEWIEARVSAALDRLGVPTTTRNDALMLPRQPLVVVRLQTIRIDRATFAWSLSLAVHQRVELRDSAETTIGAQTWAANSTLGATSGFRLKASVEESIDEQVRELSRAWRKRESETVGPTETRALPRRSQGRAPPTKP